ncbi:GatB/YqeY domain-containing protein [bacterium]|jgi:uncharacterized protein|nr:GatB/YqeY domain-containing protein [bacterium]MBT4251004.1 GatB/YqeY domain-containing protein [bacterium]MBT4597764.1 GatB/YqeY domain-containing protein [bacterium]MBT6753859.1 GatB/YqeY domain-containing protein [bacterium]MBT7037429.1 GatB/YqeY domain-containing protein [bacterium]
MSLRETIANDFKAAFKERKLLEKGVLSLLQAEIKNREIEIGKREEGLNDEEVVLLVQRAIKQRKDSMQQYADAGRAELAEAEESEISVLDKYLPEQLSEEVIEKEVRKVIEKFGAGAGDFGKVMGAAMSALKGKTDGDTVRKIVQKLLA